MQIGRKLRLFLSHLHFSRYVPLSKLVDISEKGIDPKHVGFSLPVIKTFETRDTGATAYSPNNEKRKIFHQRRTQPN